MTEIKNFIIPSFLAGILGSLYHIPYINQFTTPEQVLIILGQVSLSFFIVTFFALFLTELLFDRKKQVKTA